MTDELYHYGIKRRSGRYPWGSGAKKSRNASDFLSTVDVLEKDGFNEKQIAEYFGLQTKQLRAYKSNAHNEVRAAKAAMALRLKDKGYSNSEIGRRMDINESSVRSLLDPAISMRKNASTNTAEMLEKEIASKKYIDVGGGVENQIGVSRNTLDNAVEQLRAKGYTYHYLKVEQLGTGKFTSIKVLAAPDVTYKEVKDNQAKVTSPGFYSEDLGQTVVGIKPPSSISSKRILVNYGDQGGADKDGVIELRRGVKDLDLGAARYAQVRVAVDGTHYLKGMAMYSDDIPKGYDVIFNTNKNSSTPKMDVFKKMKDDPENPFGATIRQKTYIGKDGKEHLSALNIVNEEGDWNTWKKTLSSQMLSKQSTALAKKQLKLAYDIKKEEFDEICSLKNPVIKKCLLDKFADNCDSSAVHLKAAGLPRQASKVILPFPEMKDTEIYAPSYRNGEKVVLIRYPHGGTFEIPELIVNNKSNKKAKGLIGNAQDAVGINPRVAERLSGADFDGDTVLVIPVGKVKIKTSAPLKGLKNFDPKVAYPGYPGMPKPGEKGSGFDKQGKMGDISNLITDMTIKGAPADDIAAAVRHSMVVIDAEKHNLNWRQSYLDNGIANLKAKYQGASNAGASTLISRAKGDKRVPKRKDGYKVDPETGRKIFTETGETYEKNGKQVVRLQKSSKMYETEDAYSLSSGTAMENTYADHANKLKALANSARKTSLATKPIPYSPEAKAKYRQEVDSLNAKLNIALKNRPLERKAQLLANERVKLVRQNNPDMDKDDIKKLKNQALTQARLQTGASKKARLVDITDREWEAIQSGAISTNKLSQIIQNSDLDILKQRSMPRESRGISDAKRARAKMLESNGYTLAEIADSLGVSTSTISKVLNE
ncbi:helix-turn-helix domain-containing protein [Solobacterium sp.]|uniref:helix-turn-helix domain-containing protein n=1 Tax=Solobacterium sp. TaxID=2060878 RepID=UPI001CABBEE5|nr:helix-turn-helix domain-containing protein [Solobacterium sp.]MBF1086356.1 helix-turn-helix domain-containing protein [Solobacterium sp.]